MIQIEENNKKLLHLIDLWAPRLLDLKPSTISEFRNSQQRNIRQILGHMVDSASNNMHRTVHLQYQECPLEFPNYGTHGNNDRWISIQNYEAENWENLVKLWKYANLHFVHVVRNINHSKFQNTWNSGDGKLISLEKMVVDFLPHFELHIGEIEELINR